MAVSFVATSTTTVHSGTTQVTGIPVPTGTAIGDRVFIALGSRPSGTATNTPTGWTKVLDLAIGASGETEGTAAGRRRLTVMYRDRDTAWAMPTITVASGLAIVAVATTVRKAADDTWDTPVAVSGSDTTTGTGYSAASTAPLAFKADGMMLTTTILSDNVASSATNFTASGITFANEVERSDGGTATGSSIRIITGSAEVQTTGSTTVTRASTLANSSNGGTGFVMQGITAAAPPVTGGVSVVSTSTFENTAVTNSSTAPMPANLAVGNRLIWGMTFDKASGTVDTPAGWTLVTQQSGIQASHAIFTRLVTAGMPTSETVTWQTNANSVVHVITQLAGAGQISGFHTPAYSDTGSTTISLDAPAALTDGAMAIALVGVDTADAAWNVTAPGFTMLGNPNSGAFANGGAMLRSTSNLSAGQNLAATTFTQTTSDQITGSIIIVEAAPTGQDEVATATFTGSGTLSVSGTVAVSRTVGFSGSGTLSIGTVKRAAAVTATFDGSGGLTVTGGPGFVAPASFSGSGTAAVLPGLVVGKSTTGSMSGSGTLSATTKSGYLSSAVFAGSGDLTTAQQRSAAVVAALDGAGTLSVTQSLAAALTVGLTGSGTLTTTSKPSFTRPASFSGSGSLLAAALPSFIAASALSGSGTLIASVQPSLARVAALSGSGSLFVSVTKTEGQVGQFSGSGQLVAGIDELAVRSTALFTGSGDLTAVGAAALARTAIFTGLGTLSGVVRAGVSRVAAFSGTGDLDATAELAAVGLAAFTGSGLLTTGGLTIGRRLVVPLSGSGILVPALTRVTARPAVALTGTGTLIGHPSLVVVRVAAALAGEGDLEIGLTAARRLVANFTGLGRLTASHLGAGPAREVNLAYVWTGGAWVPVSLYAYRNAAYVKTRTQVS